MIKIEREKDITFLNSSVTEFADALGYCEYKIPLSIKGVKPRPSQSLILGTKAHHAEEKYEQEHLELEPVTVEEMQDEKADIEFARENVYSTLSMPFEFPTEKVLVTLSGRIDKIMRVDGTLVVQDDKFVGRPQTYENKTQPYPSQLLQVLAYLNSVYSGKRKNNPEDWFDLPHTKKKWELRICDRKTRVPVKIFSEYQDAFSLHYLHSSLEKFTTIALDISEPEHHNSQSKCQACNFKSFCEFKI
ncbi:MAG: PD-(D/E)XK nuclease family protein [Nitrosopumilaceae archaeon]